MQKQKRMYNNAKPLILLRIIIQRRQDRDERHRSNHESELKLFLIIRGCNVNEIFLLVPGPFHPFEIFFRIIPVIKCFDGEFVSIVI